MPSSATARWTAYLKIKLALIYLQLRYGDSKWRYIGPGLALYFFLQRILRYRRARKFPKQYGFSDGRPLSLMTVEEARTIILTLQQQEFPMTFFYATSFALFKTYSIPTISRLLTSTSQLSSPVTSSKRTSDTIVLLVELLANAPSTSRGVDAIARMNYLHAGYRARGAILDDDMLYTLGLFALEPARWVNTYEWRELTDVEACALGSFWKSVGDAMEIPYASRLPSADLGWTDGLHWLKEMRVWCAEYEKRAQRFDPANRRVADTTMDILLWAVPLSLRPTAVRAATVVFESGLREAMGYPKPSTAAIVPVHLAIFLRKMVLRYLALPRPYALRFRYAPEYNARTGKLNLPFYFDRPWYVAPSAATRWGLKGWLAWLAGAAVPGDSDEYYPDGFSIGDVGPKHQMGKGVEEMKRTKEQLSKLERGGCPFAIERHF